MLEIFSILPLSFWAVIALLIGGGLLAWQRMEDGTGLPMLMVLVTTTAWYVGDAFYNDYAHNHAKRFEAGTLEGAWWQVAWFILVFLLITPPLHRWINRRYERNKSGIVQLFQNGVDQPMLQRQLGLLFTGCTWIWFGLFLIALVALKDETIYYLFPFLGYSASPWTHGRVGAGFDCLSVIGIYLQLLTANMFGIVLALTTNNRIRRYALLLCLLAWPAFIFSRTRNTMLAMVIPAVLSWVFLRVHGGIWKKAVVLLACFLVVNVWMKFIIANRSQMSITQAFHEKGLNLAEQKKVHNEGLNMYEELCWISTFIDNGRYQVNWGERYFAELVNPVPRALWPGKPLIGIDYAIARGHAQADDTQGGVNTTISTGMIGQGVVNFGRVLGPAASAILMSLWVIWLARFDLRIQEFGCLPLYALGIILTFNLGRDITLITLYPFVFGALLVAWMEHARSRRNQLVPAAAAESGPGEETRAKSVFPPNRSGHRRPLFPPTPQLEFFGRKAPAKMPVKQTPEPTSE